MDLLSDEKEIVDDVVEHIRKNTSGLSHIQIENLLHALFNAIERMELPSQSDEPNAPMYLNERCLHLGMRAGRLRDAILITRQKKRAGWGTSDSGLLNRRGSHHK